MVSYDPLTSHDSCPSPVGVCCSGSGITTSTTSSMGVAFSDHHFKSLSVSVANRFNRDTPAMAACTQRRPQWPPLCEPLIYSNQWRLGVLLLVPLVETLRVVQHHLALLTEGDGLLLTTVLALHEITKGTVAPVHPFRTEMTTCEPVWGSQCVCSPHHALMRAPQT
eukprot:546824-Rhodomonas_salina.1